MNASHHITHNSSVGGELAYFLPTGWRGGLLALIIQLDFLPHHVDCTYEVSMTCKWPHSKVVKVVFFCHSEYFRDTDLAKTHTLIGTNFKSQQNA